MQHTITEHFTKYHPERLTFSERPDKALLGNGIIIRIKLKELPNGDRKTIFEIPGALKIETGVYRFPEALENMDFYREGECYDVYADANGNSPLPCTIHSSFTPNTSTNFFLNSSSA